MIYDNHIPDNAINRQVFYANGTNDWVTWTKPHNCKFIYIFCLGSGGGGGGGHGTSSGTARRGGNGGGSSSSTSGLFQASMLPDTLYFRIARGGAGGLGGTVGITPGTVGGLTYVSIQPNITAANILMQSGTVAAAGGSATAGGTTLGGTVWGPTNFILSCYGLIVSSAGANGGIGQTTAASPPMPITKITTGGGAGAGCNSATSQTGAEITGVGSIVTVPGGFAGGSGAVVAPGGDGSTFMTINPGSMNYGNQNLFFAGGSGGGSSNFSNGGNGGNASYGSGGGGGGAGFTSLGGRGGNGGDGLIIVTCF